jgi:two-component system, chemotaxis family, chemotaxis protein CheY
MGQYAQFEVHMSKIMVVEDSSTSRLIVADMVRSGGHQVVEARDGMEAVEKYPSEHPDVVLMDLTMPRMDGLSALAAIRRYDPTARIIMLTASAEMKTTVTAIRLGARDFVIKPFNAARLLTSISQLLAQAGPLKGPVPSAANPAANQ